MPTDFSTLQSVQSSVGQSLDDREKLLNSAATLGVQIASYQSAAAQAFAVGNLAAAQAAQKQADDAQQNRTAVQEKISAIDKDVRDQINRLTNLDPCDAEADVPLALFPVRLETRYSVDGAQLRIRIFPDDIHVDGLDRGVTDDEVAAGKAYWNAIWPTDDADVASEAYRTLAALVHADRAAWVAAALTPTNLASAGPSVAPAFPPVTPRSRRAAVARLLPDRFVAVAIQGDARATAKGTAVIADLVVGLLSDDGAELVPAGPGLTVQPGTEWLYDYDRAVAAGMAITLPLARAGAAVDQLFVFGVRGSFDTNRTQATLEDLLKAHRYTRGLAVVPQGTPTNNTETDRAGWQSTVTPPPPGRAAATEPAVGSNAAVLAGALGVDGLAFAGIDHATEREQPQAHAMNTALWWPSWGTMLDSASTGDGTKLSDAVREGIRNFFNNSVRGRGPVPALRVGDQPYGVLPVGSTDVRWKAQSGDLLDDTLLTFLKRVRTAWRVSLPNVPRIDRGGAGLDSTVLDILGSSPVAEGLRVRTVIPDDFPLVVGDVTGTPQDQQELERIIGQFIWEAIVQASLVSPAGSLAKGSRPLPLPFVDLSDPTFIDGLLAGAPPPVTSVLQALLQLSWSAAQIAVQQAAPKSLVPKLMEETPNLPPDLRDAVMLIVNGDDNVSSNTMISTANMVASQFGEFGAVAKAQHEPIPALRTSLGEIAIAATSTAASSQIAALAISAWTRAKARVAELRDALTELRNIGSDSTALDVRRILVAETLDLGSHRLDAWLTGIAERRRASLRAAKPNGVIVGAYGWVENLQRSTAQGPNRDGGFIHAPSLAHANTAGLLRSAYLTHNPDASGNGAFAVDLSSARVRLALDIIEGLRQGQTLGALLGYRIERSLHEQNLDRLVLSLRTLAPLVDGQLTTRNDVVPPEAKEAVAASNVVDGLKLIELFTANPDSVYAAAANPPLNNPYITADNWPKPPLSADDKTRLDSAIQTAIDANDAHADLVLAEAVHQLAQGNTGRAAAALDNAGSGGAPPIEPTVTQTPNQGIPFTHRLMLIAVADAANVGGWNTDRPRAKAEPRLETWAESRLGSAANVVVFAAADGTLTSLDAAGLAALDVVYESANLVRLEQAIRAAMPAIPVDAPLTSVKGAGWPVDAKSFSEIAQLAASIRELLTRARIAGPADFARPSDKPERTVSADELNAIKARATDARAGLAAALASLDGLLAPAGISPTDAALSAALEALAAYGVATPRSGGETYLAMAQMASSAGHRRIETTDKLLGGSFDAQTAAAASQALFGEGFWMIPALAPPAQPDLFSISLAGAGVVSPARGAIRRFIRDVASVRDAVERLSESLLFGDALGRRASLRVAQLATADTPGANRWVGGKLDLAQPTPNKPVTSIVLEAPPDYDGTTAAPALVVDQWVDVVPLREQRTNGDATVINDRRVSGLAVNAAAASARAPQAILLAISPDGARWTTGAVLDTLIDTLELAKLRGVSLERTTGAARILPAWYEQSWSLQGEPVLDFRYVKDHMVIAAMVPYVKEGQ